MMSDATPIDAQPVVIIGAGRSGTNMLRDVLTRLDGFATWPCDEINYIWRHGNRELPTDEFAAAEARPAVKRFIRQRFAAQVARSGLLREPAARRFLVEKTCANSLRVPFVHAVVPEARFIYLVRDGRDVVRSAHSRWKAPLDIGYLAAKARYVPVSDLPYYASRYLSNRLRKVLHPENALAVWGPRFEGMQAAARDHSLEYLCALQWSRCVAASDAALSSLSAQQVHALRYEDFVADPDAQLAAVLQFLGVVASSDERAAALQGVHASSVGRGAADFGERYPDALAAMQETLMVHGYLDERHTSSQPVAAIA